MRLSPILLLMKTTMMMMMMTPQAASVEDIVRRCLEECDSTLVVEKKDDFDMRCDEKCKMAECSKGCDQWRDSVPVDCREACLLPQDATNESSDAVHAEELYCIMGCHLGGSAFLQRVRDEVGVPGAPVLVAESAGNDSVSVKWPVDSTYNVSYLVQWKYERSQDSWEFYRPHEPVLRNELKIEGLRPYTKYKFRVAWLVAPNERVVFSEESNVISTLAYGAPSTAPTITSLSAVDWTRVSVSWTPPDFANGPIFSYAAYLRDSLSGSVQIKDVREASYLTFTNLKPNTTYAVSVSCRNAVGEGPASSGNVTTLPLPQASDRFEPLLVLAAQRRLMAHNLHATRIFEQPDSLCTVESVIVDVAVHVERRTVFFSSVDGAVRGYSVDNGTTVALLNSTSDSSRLSVDWLNDLLYFSNDNEVLRVDLRGKDPRPVIKDLNGAPSDMHVDPFNGYLFLSVPGVGLCRVDLGAVAEGPVSANSRPDFRVVVRDGNLRSFAVGYRDFQLLLPDDAENTVLSASLDGADTTNVRSNIQKGMLKNVTSLSVFKGLFYWTNGDEVICEEYDPVEKKYYHNSLMDFTTDGPFGSLDILHPDAQPYPVPINAVEDLQAAFLAHSAKISWSPPKLLGSSGAGAWQSWRYELTLRSAEGAAESVDTLENNCTVDNLTRDTEYTIRVRAYSPGGKGPWSQSFKGRTLRTGLGNESGFPYLLWSGRDGVLRSDMVADSVQPFVNHLSLQRSRVTDMSWYEDLLFLNTNKSLVFSFNASEHSPPTLLGDAKPAVAVAVDWLAKKLYWSNPRQQLVSRANLDGSQQEPLPIVTVAKELNVDAVGAGLYWTTAHTVEYSKLNGANRHVYFQADFFSGTQVMGLTLDFDHRVLYWTTRSFQGSGLYRASMMTLDGAAHEEDAQLVSIFPQDTGRGPLRYFSRRLYWIRDGKEAMVSDVDGRNTARLGNVGLADLTALTVVDPSLQPSPPGRVEVIPHRVAEDSIELMGTLENFNITWQETTNVNHGVVFYEVKAENAEARTSAIDITERSAVRYRSRHEPYALLTVSVRAFTYWGSARPSVRALRTPMSTPSAPLRPRVFIVYGISGPKEVAAELRWAPPGSPNGVVSGYVTHCWTYEGSQPEKVPVAGQDLQNPEKLSFEVRGLRPNGTYYFQVRAYTEVGTGPPSEVVAARTDEERPVPRLLLTRGQSVRVADVDSKEESVLATDAATPLDVVFLGRENSVYWLDGESSLMRSSLDGSNKTRVRILSGPANSLTVDWVGRHLYWSQVDLDSRTGTIWDMDLSSGEDPEIVVQRRASTVGSVEVVPFTGSLVWTDVDDRGVGQLMTGSLDGSAVRPFLGSPGRRRRFSEDCDCPEEMAVEKALTLDSSEASAPKVLFVEALTGRIWSADVRGCSCQLLVDASSPDRSGIPPTSLTADKGRVYWSNSSLGRVFSFPKGGSGGDATSREAEGIGSVSAMGSHLQPYPEDECLSPEDYSRGALVSEVTTDSVTLSLEPASFPRRCGAASFASVAYTVLYGPADADVKLRVTTYNSPVRLADLAAYTRYSVSVAVGNHYSRRPPVQGPATVFRTLEGAPSEPRGVSVTGLDPRRANVTWQSPAEVRGPAVDYLVNWRRSVSVKDAKSSVLFQDEVRSVDYTLEGLEPGKTYFVSVKACSSDGSLCNASREVEFTAWSEPDSLDPVAVTMNSIQLAWTSPSSYGIREHELQYKKKGYGEDWFGVGEPVATAPNLTYRMEARDLSPRTRYAFRMSVRFAASPSDSYLWPTDDSLVFQTEGGRPGAPGTPSVLNVGGDVYRVQWEPGEDNGAPVLFYILQTKDESADEWLTVYNGSETKWVVEGLDADRRYAFAAGAFNEYGYGDRSFSDSHVNLIHGAALFGGDDSRLGVALAASLSAVVTVAAVATLVLFRACRRAREKGEKKMSESLQDPDVELATLRDLPRHANFVHRDNALYTVGDAPTDEEVAVLPRIFREQITLSKFLGSGAFGEVFEGIARDLPGTVEREGSRVAIKTLRKGATDQEKGEFLKEALLMSNFKHDHILRLLGICLDNDPNFIILELMEGGDLLSYLRGGRPSSMPSCSSLTVQELISVCLDVAKGCRYLEDMHFVHRDLAARNCLVSGHDPTTRVVKIGDFGLARDIYKNDYYRKEGEGLLPVRWMSPESLVDGVFTSQSDVWAFGVLLWEVMTYGQQPYPARTNLEVLHYVRAGGRLDNPDNCPDDLHRLMHECWSYAPCDRPTFKYCYRKLQEMRRKSAEPAPPCVHNRNYFGRNAAAVAVFDPRLGGFDNPGYSEEDLLPTSASDDEDELRLLPAVKVPSTRVPDNDGGYLRALLDPDVRPETPQYLELLRDDGDDRGTPTNDGPLKTGSLEEAPATTDGRVPCN